MISDEQLYSFWDSKEQAEMITCGAVYPESVMQGYQHGEQISLSGCRIVRHSCGFAFIFGIPTARDLEQIIFLMHTAGEKGERFVLFCENERLGRYFEMNSGVKVEKRYFFELAQDKSGDIILPENFVMKPIDADILPRLDGRIKPSFSWESDESFLQKGKGFCAMYEDTPAAWAFSAAVSDREIDIGVETLEGFRGKGLAAAVAGKMAAYVLSIGKKSVWACHSENIASRKTAEKIGFEKVGECSTIHL
ncbi:MAG: GNAT family N-acetyltransferase [Ruminococcus sp.]|nr:GNAT family N-acetyltransferase [Ruminococcus sp.]